MMKNNLIRLFFLLLTFSAFSQPLKLDQREKVSGPINSESDELSPIFNSDFSKVYITRSNHEGNIGGISKGQDIWVASLESLNKTSEVNNLGEKVNNIFHNIIYGVSEDGNTIYVSATYKKAKKDKIGIAKITKSGGEWGEPVLTPIEDFEFKRAFYTFYVTPDEKTLLVSMPKDTNDLNNEDIFVSQMTAEGTWTKPTSLGSSINTNGFETSPFLYSDGKTLFFTSNGRSGGQGGGDIYMSVRQGNSWTNWSEPQNLGNKINTSGLDSYFRLSKDSIAYFISGETANDLGDLYTSKILPPEYFVAGKIQSAKNDSALAGVKIIVKNSNNEVIKEVVTDVNGEYKLVLNKKENISIVADIKDYVSIDERVSSDKLIAEKTYTTPLVKLSPIEVGKTITLKHVYFDYNKTEVLPESYQELDLLVLIMQENETMEIHIAGHTDDQGEHGYNLKLSEDRSKSVADYIVAKGIDKSRLTNKGYGESQPVVANDTEENRAQNRRVEFTITKK